MNPCRTRPMNRVVRSAVVERKGPTVSPSRFVWRYGSYGGDDIMEEEGT